MDAAQRLGVPPGADAATIRAAFARAARAVHPDTTAGACGDGGELSALIEARDALLDRLESPRRATTVVFYEHKSLWRQAAARLTRSRRRRSPGRLLH